MFATRRSRALGLLGLLALVGWALLRHRRRSGAAVPDARPARAPDAVASEDVTDDVHTDLDATVDTATPDTATPDTATPDTATPATVTAAEQDDAAPVAEEAAPADEPVVTARVYDVSEPPVVDEPAAAVEPEPVVASIDLDRIERDLEGVEAALRRLDEGTYWTDEVTGEAIDEALLVADPVARRNVA